jgi:uncharacterized protein YcbK (DUF882 family)
MQLSKNFTLEELTRSGTALQYKIDNNPNTQQINSLKTLCERCLQKIRDGLKSPVVISSGFRSAKLNKTIGGAANSQHLQGKAADFTVKGYTVKQVFDWCRNPSNGLVFDQLINEKNQWVHISFNISANRKETLVYDGKSYKNA